MGVDTVNDTCPICGTTFTANNRTGCEVRVTATIPGILWGQASEETCCENCIYDMDRALQMWKAGLFRKWRNMLPASAWISFFKEDFPTSEHCQDKGVLGD